MKSKFLINFKYFLINLRKLYSSVLWYELNNIKNIKKSEKKFKIIVLKSKTNITKFNLNEYFDKYKFKLKRLNKKNHFLALVIKRKILSSGWIYLGKKWKITEINLNVNIKNQNLLYDFYTPKNLRNKGYYKLLLKLIIKKFKKKNLAIYSLSYNYKSNQAIKKSGFKLIKKIYGF